MEFKKNPELIEKPDHAHYPVCRGRLDEINDIGRRTFFYTIGVCCILALFSLLATPMHLVGWVPLMFTLKDATAFGMSAHFSISQLSMCFVFFIIALLGTTSRKIFNVITFFLYALMLVISILVRLTPFDFITAIAGAGGMFVSIGALKGYSDFKQLRNTEGYPIFSTILADHDDQKKHSPNGYNKKHFDKLLHEKAMRERNIAPNNTNGQQPVLNLTQPQSPVNNDIGAMPSLNVTSPVRNSAVGQKFVPKAHKEVFFSDCTLKIK
ncbi:hypothetical protein [Ruminococcus flavefaciens]|uniref:Uncharacterized protein n=1 Tax=Ruminococcus flavefaciens TaxID=1265 RepID=A0A1M7JUY0_RUMFL|nr:hypothetical protein [Ruminococcus flavefaciens]SHM56347.1 hypothetical protein SAMN04487860_106211 [Ruminococcus flavefaciens]